MDTQIEKQVLPDKPASKLVNGWFEKRWPEIKARGALHPVYTGVTDWLYDFYPDLSWSDVITDLRWFILHETFPEVKAFFLEHYQFDLEALFKKDVEELTRTEKEDLAS